MFHKLVPQYLNQHFRVADSHPYRTRSNLYNFTVPSQTFYYNAILDRNNLPDDIKSITNKCTHKTAVKRHLWTARHSHEADIYKYFEHHCIV